MFDIFLRGLKDIIVNPFFAILPKFKFSPNWITLMSGVFGVI